MASVAHPAAPAGRQDGPLYVVAEGASRKGATRLWPCPLEGAMFLCGTSLAFVDGAFVDAKARMPAAFAGTVSGRWPEAVWSVSRVGPEPELLRWEAEREQWTHVADLGPPLMNELKATSIAVGPWPGGGALVVEYVPTVTACEHGPRDCIRISIHGPSKRALPRFVSDQGRPVLEVVGNVAIFDSGDLVMVGWRNRATFVAHWQPGQTWPNVERVGDGRCAGRRVIGSSAGDLVVAGRLSGSGQAPTPCADRLVRGAWTRLVFPAWGTDVISYAKQPDGTEWVALRRELAEGTRQWAATLWSRLPKRDWNEVKLPPPAPMVRGWPGRLVAAETWAQSNGDLWVLADYADTCGTREHVLYKNTPARSVCKMLGASSRCLEPEDYPPDSWSWTCKESSPSQVP